MSAFDPGARSGGRRGAVLLAIVIVGLAASPAVVHATGANPPLAAGRRLTPLRLYDDAGRDQRKPDAAAPCAGETCSNGGIGGRRGAARLPEPASWALMLIGAGGVGALARRRRARGGLAR